MKKIVLITGANGMLAQQLSKLLEHDYTIRFLSRNPIAENEYLWDVDKGYLDPESIKNIHSIIHLAGASIADGRWTEKRKEIIISSRVKTAKLLLSELHRNNQTIDSFISASAVGYYGAITTDEILKEDSPKGIDFLSDVCAKWENVANAFKTEKIASRVAIARIGIILAKNDGAIKKIIQPIKYGVGSGLGTGKQYVPWIHIDDLCGIFKHILNHKNIDGTYNAVAPEHITNMEMTKQIASVIKRKIWLPNIPSFIFKLLFGEMSVILLEGTRVASEKIVKSGFSFQFKIFENAIKGIV